MADVVIDDPLATPLMQFAANVHDVGVFELRDHLESVGESAIPACSVVRTSAGNLPFSHIIHAVAIDPFYDSSPQIVSDTLASAFRLAVSLGTKSISMPTLATGYGPMTVDGFARAFVNSVVGRFQLETVTVVVRSDENAAIINSALASAK